jgi:hypothetical protein
MFAYTLILSAVLGADVAPSTVIETDRVSVALTERGAIRSMFDKKAKRELFHASGTTPLFRLDYSDGDYAKPTLKMCHSLQADQVRIESSPRQVKITFKGFEGQPIEVICTISAGDDEMVHFGLEALLPPGVVLESVSYPLMTVGAPLFTNGNGSVVTGATKGGVYRLSDWKKDQTRRFDQPRSLGAGFACCYDDAGGMYTATRDSHQYRKSLGLKRTAEGLEWRWTHPCFHRKQFTLPYDIVLGAFASPQADRPTDWRDAADIYKAWAVKQSWCSKTFVQREDIPDWLKQAPAMVRFTRAWLSRPESIEAWYRDYWQKEFPTKSPLITAYWGWEHVGKWVGPQYFPAYPSDKQFQRLVQLGRDIGSHTFLWPSGYHYNLSYARRPDGSFSWDNRKQLNSIAGHMVVDRSGEIFLRDCWWLRGGHQCTMCPGDPWTINWLNSSAVECAQHGAELIQIDQAVGGEFPACYSHCHPHEPGPGLWTTEVFHQQLRSMLRLCRDVEPDTVLGFEQPNEWFIQEIGIQDYRDCDLIWQGDEPASVFAYLYHEYIPTLFQSNRSQTGHDPWALAWCLVNGQIPHLAARLGIGPGPMITDGGFERSDDEGSVEFPRTMMFLGSPLCSGDTQIDTDRPHSGRTCLKLFNHEPKGNAMAAQNYEVSEHLCPGRTYRFSVWMRSKGVAQPNGVVLKALAPGMSILQTWTLPYPADQAEWTQSQLDFVMPEGTTALRVMLLLSGEGTAWLDDVKLEEVLPNGQLAEVQRPALPVDHEFMRNWIKLYQGEGRRYLLLGKMLHPPRLESGVPIAAGQRNLPPVLHNAFEAPDGTQAVVLANWTLKPQSVKLAWKGRTQALDLRPAEVRLVQ